MPFECFAVHGMICWSPQKLEHQAYDSVLREDDRKEGAFTKLVSYILRNPVRKNLVQTWAEWPYSGCLFPGYPKLDPRKSYFWDNFWKAYREQGE